MSWRWSALVAVLLAPIGIAAHGAWAQTASPEDAVKATFLSRFPSFVEWPASAFASADAPIQLCVNGAEPFRELMARTTLDQRVGGRAIVVRSLANVSDVSGCHVVYSSGAATDETLHAAQGSPILTVTDAASRTGGRGMIHFVLVDNRVRFYADDALAAQNRLSISSRLLSLAISVRTRQASR
jgi:YfiR/HmsC-like